MSEVLTTRRASSMPAEPNPCFRLIRSLKHAALDQLVATGRAVGLMNFTTAGKAAIKRQSLLARFEEAGIKPTPYRPPAEAAPPATDREES